jgi:hypothetical protein
MQGVAVLKQSHPSRLTSSLNAGKIGGQSIMKGLISKKRPSRTFNSSYSLYPEKNVILEILGQIINEVK